MSRSLIYLIILICCLKAIMLRQVCLAFKVIELWMQNMWKGKRLVRDSGLDAAKKRYHRAGSNRDVNSSGCCQGQENKHINFN